MSAKRNRPGVASEAAPKVIAATTISIAQSRDIHPAETAELAAQGWMIHSLEQSARTLAATGRPFVIDDALDNAGLSVSGNWTGGTMMRLHRAGIIRKAGWRPSTRPSRNGSIVTIWVGADVEALAS